MKVIAFLTKSYNYNKVGILHVNNSCLFIGEVDESEMNEGWICTFAHISMIIVRVPEYEIGSAVYFNNLLLPVQKL